MSLPTPTLHTARLRLRPFDDADANDLFALHSNAHVLRYWDTPPWSEPVRSERAGLLGHCAAKPLPNADLVRLRVGPARSEFDAQRGQLCSTTSAGCGRGCLRCR
jgi:hypothetical protein